MPLPTKNFFYFITDSQGRSLWVDHSGINPTIQTSSPPVPLPQHPKGWKDIQISFGTSSKYFSLNRAFSVPMFFVGDGAFICRDAVYKLRGYQEELYVVILKLNPQTGVYELEYKGRLDFGKFSDEPRKGITVNSIEGGVLQFLNNNDSIQYEIPLDITNPDSIQVLFTGVTLYDRFRYSEISVDIPKLTDFDHHTVGYTIPIAFISNEGDSVGIVFGTQEYEEIAFSGTWTNSLLNPYTASSVNSPFYSISPITIQKISGNIVFDLHYADGSFGVWIVLQTSLGTRYNILGAPSSYTQYTASQTVTVPISLQVPLAANEKVFIIAVTSSNSTNDQSVTWQTADIFFEFNSINPPSKAYHLQSLYLWRQLVLRMTDGKYTGDSLYLTANKNIGWTSTNALRNFSYSYYFGPFDVIDTTGVYTIKIPGTLANFPDGSELVISEAISNNGGYTVVSTSLATIGYTIIEVAEPLTTATITGQISAGAAIKMSVEDFYNDLNCDKPMVIRPRGNVLYIEPVEDIYNDDTEIEDIGEITDLEFNYKYDWLCNTAKFGSKSQDYRQRNGRYEFNTTTLFNLPVDVLKKELTRVTKSRRDCFGEEFIRALIFDKPTTDTTSDNQAFMNDLVKGVIFTFYTGAFLTQDISGSYFISIFPPINTSVLSPGDTVTISGAASNNGNYTIISVGGSLASTDILVVEPVTSANLNGNLSINNPNLWQPNRPAYDSITGVLDNSVFNTQITPHHQLLGWARWLSGMLYQLQQGRIVYRTSDKNGDLVTTLAGVTIAEKQDELVANLGNPFFYFISASFKTVVPITFARSLAAANNGYIKATYIGVPLYFIPIGNMHCKPATNDTQEWECILAGPDKNSLDTINSLSLESDFIMATDGIQTSFLNALHWVKYNHTLPAKYSHQFMDEDWSINRNPDYTYNPFFPQKWQTTENIPDQQITRGLGQLSIQWYDAMGVAYGTLHSYTITADPAVIAPNTRQDYTQDISDFAEGYYFAVILDGETPLRISEPIWVKAVHEGTLLLNYSHSTNKYGYFWTGVDPVNIRVDASLGEPYPDNTFVDYQDELAGTETIDGIPVMKQIFELAECPAWLARKVCMIQLLNQWYIQDKHFSRSPESKISPVKVEGSPMYKYEIEVMEAVQGYGLTTDADGNQEDLFAAATLDAQAFGEAPDGAVIEIDVPLTP